MARYSKKEQQEAVERLRMIVPPGTTLYTVLRSVARSGMSRVIDVYMIEDNTPHYLTGWVAAALDWTRTDDGIRVQGCGMDAGFHLVHTLSYRLHPDGFECLDKDAKGSRVCPSNDHSNAYSFLREGKEVPQFHTQGGYSLFQKWM